MPQGNYERILEKIAQAAGIEKSDVERQVEAKRSKLSGLISKEGAAQVVASELGVSFENEKLKIDELLPGMRKFNLVGQVTEILPVRTFKTKSGEESKVVNLWVADDTAIIRVVLWDTNHIGLIEKGEISQGSSVEILNGSMRDNEIHLGSFSEFKLSEEKFDNIKTEVILPEKTISKLNKGDSSQLRAFIVQAFEPRFFSVCPECGKKPQQEGETFVCKEHGKIVPEKRALINVVLDDGTESIRAVLFHEKISNLGINLKAENLVEEKEKILGKEMIFVGNVRTNTYFNNEEFIVDNVREVDLDDVIVKLEK